MNEAARTNLQERKRDLADKTLAKGLRKRMDDKKGAMQRQVKRIRDQGIVTN